MDFSGKNVAVIGYGVEGKASVEYLLQHGAKVTVLDQRVEITLPSGVDSKLGDNYLNNLEQFNLVLRAPAVRPELLKKVESSSATQLFLDICPVPVIGVTGTKGKGTTSTLITKLLEDQGLKTWLGGNIGVPMLSFLDQITDQNAVVLELSSFQLMDITKSPEIAVCLMIAEDHLNWHTDMDEYISAKANITDHQSETDVFIHHPTNTHVQKIASQSPATKLPFMKQPQCYIDRESVIYRGEKLMNVSSVGLIGSHNLENICAALTAVAEYAARRSVEFNLDQLKQTIKEFNGLEHRLEFVREINGVKYYNDSFSTMPAAGVAGIKSFDEPVVTIAGGVDKNVDLTEFAQELASTKFVVLIGEIAPKLARLFDNFSFKNYAITEGPMDDIVNSAKSKAEEGDIVLMSPGSSSFDMFESYKERGRLFKESVNNL